MPQLDTLSYTTQLVWFFSVYFIVYVFFLRRVIPTIGFTLKFRTRVLKDVRSPEIINLEKEVNELNNKFRVLLTEFLDNLNEVLKEVEVLDECQREQYTLLLRDSVASKELRDMYIKEMTSIILKVQLVEISSRKYQLILNP